MNQFGNIRYPTDAQLVFISYYYVFWWRLTVSFQVTNFSKVSQHAAAGVNKLKLVS